MAKKGGKGKGRINKNALVEMLTVFGYPFG
jgi:hypothetical protein